MQGQLELLAAEQEALAKVAGISVSQTNSGLEGEIDKLQHSVPEVVDRKVRLCGQGNSGRSGTSAVNEAAPNRTRSAFS